MRSPFLGFAKFACAVLIIFAVAACGGQAGSPPASVMITPVPPTLVPTATPVPPTLVPTAAPVLTDGPVDVVNRMIGFVEAGEYTRVADIACVADRQTVADKFDIAKSVGSDLPAGVDPADLVAALHMTFPGLSVTEVSRTDTKAAVAVKGTMTMVVDEVKLKSFIKQMLATEGAPTDAKTVDLALTTTLKGLQTDQAVDSVATVVMENGHWVVCGFADTAAAPSAAPTESLTPASITEASAAALRLFTLTAAKDAAGLADLVCPSKRSEIIDTMDFAKSLAAQLPGYDVTDLAASIHMTFSDMNATETRRAATAMTYVITGRADVSWNEGLMREYVAGLIRAQGAQGTAAEVDSAMASFEKTRSQAITDSVDVILSNDRWLVCGFTPIDIPSPAVSPGG